MNIFSIATLLSVVPIGLLLLFLYRTLSLRQQGEISLINAYFRPKSTGLMGRLLDESDYPLSRQPARIFAANGPKVPHPAPGVFPQLPAQFIERTSGVMSWLSRLSYCTRAEDRGDLAVAL